MNPFDLFGHACIVTAMYCNGPRPTSEACLANKHETERETLVGFACSGDGALSILRHVISSIDARHDSGDCDGDPSASALRQPV